MIYTVTFNPALDYLVWTNNFTPGITNRSQKEELQFGGKGINVSVVLSRLGVPTTALGFVAGFTGRALEEALQKEGIQTAFITLPQGNTRINVKLKGETETEINAGGPPIDTASAAALFRQLEQLTKEDTLVLAGSVPSGMPHNTYCRIVEKMQQNGVRCVVDATGELLLETLRFAPFLIKPNKQELEELCGKTLTSEEEVIAAAKELQRRGAKNVLVSLGSDGALLLDESGVIHKKSAAKGTVVNTVGAGDSMVAGFLYGAANGYEEALRFGVAAGSATAFSLGLAEKADVLRLL